ncbi:ComEC/Rec2 family competence protein [Streptomyces odontomachi]|uniref:ComEC/Rec2 family competence protein n=1 Tax=Streptomyces odontomachi TaxID=2944940 RepID=UPI00210C4585|nr:ComEC/Rec2 family competence protein [Streptomyces sp. ODS25]
MSTDATGRRAGGPRQTRQPTSPAGDAGSRLGTAPESTAADPYHAPDPYRGTEPGSGSCRGEPRPASGAAARAAVHRDAASRLGASHPRQEGPADLRLVPPALAAWGTAAVLVDAPSSWVIVAVLGCVGVAVGLLAVPARKAGGRGPAGRRTGRRYAAGRMSAAAVLLCVAAAAASAGLHGADLHRGPVPDLAHRYARVTVDLDITSDPRRTRPRVTGDHMAPVAVVADARAVRIRTADGGGWETRTPVLVIVDAPQGDGGPGRSGTRSPSGARSPSGVRSTSGARSRAAPEPGWEGLLPSTRVRVRARLAPPMHGGDRIAAVVRVARGEPPRVVRPPSAPQRFAGRLREGLRTAVRGLSPDARALLPGLVVGDTSGVSPELEDAFRATDLTHVLAVSGANFTILLAVLVGPPGLAHRAERRGLAGRLGLGLRSTAVLGGALALGFVVVCRPEPSVLRAAACGGIVLLALATGRRRALLPALAAVVLLLALYDPWLARSPGFVLSVLATGALLTLAPRWAAALRSRGLPSRVAEALAAAAAAQVVCAPVVVMLAARVSLVAVPCNLLAECVVGPATVLGFAALVTAPVAMPLARAFAWCAGWPVNWLADIARTGADLPGGGVPWSGGWRGGVLLAVAMVVLIGVGRRLIRHPWVCLVCVAGLLLFVLQPAPLPRVLAGWPPPGWRFAMCDVGQGDATVLAVGDGSAVVVDTGPEPALVDHCLRALGITRIPLVLLTHFHADHVAGLTGVLRGRRVAAIETTSLQEPADQAAFVRRTAAERHIPVRRVLPGERRRTGALTWQVLWPPARPAPQPDDPNDASIALLVHTAGLRLLLLGDLEPPAQQGLLRSPAGVDLAHVDVMKVAHHGSAYQDPWLLRTAAPRLALISCGAGNPYGHPSPRTVAALRTSGAMVLRTDRNGSLAVTGTTPQGLRVAQSRASPG